MTIVECVDCKKNLTHHARGRCCNCYQKFQYKIKPNIKERQKAYRKMYLSIPENKMKYKDYLRNYMRKRLNIPKDKWRKE